MLSPGGATPVVMMRRGEPGYPSQLEDLGADAPRTLHFRGRPLTHLEGSVAIVGSRRASEAGRDWTYALARRLAEAGRPVISGGALGIDAAAHAGALEGGGPTLVVLPSDVRQPRPLSNRALFSAVLQGDGAIMSEFDRPRGGRWLYAHRNRIVAALAEAVVVVEAGAKSGTRHTMDKALALGRPLICLAWPFGDPRGDGALAMGEAARSVRTPDEVIRILEGSVESPEVAGEDDSALWRALGTPKTLDQLQALLRLDGPQLTAQLFEAELKGWVGRMGGRWHRVR